MQNGTGFNAMWYLGRVHDESFGWLLCNVANFSQESDAEYFMIYKGNMNTDYCFTSKIYILFKRLYFKG